MANLKSLAIIAAIAVVALVGSFSYYSVSEQNFGFTLTKEQLEIIAYKNWKKEFTHQLGDREDKVRFGLFQKNLNFILSSNANPNSTFKLALNKFAGYSKEEFSALFLGDNDEPEIPINVTVLDTTNMSAAVDWTQKGAVTPVKNQGRCGSCWTFSATGALEGLMAIREGQLVSFSEQQLVDCASSYGNNGCNGGLAMYAFRYVAANGIVLETDYPYQAKDQACNIPAAANRFNITDFTMVPKYSSAQLQAALSNQPVAVSVQADSDVFRFYKSGILNDNSCGTDLNHAILAVGYGTENSTTYVKVKNSWGEEWGSSGYIYLAMQDGPGICGVNTRPTYPYV